MVRYIRSIGLALLFSAFVGSLGQTEGRALNYLMSLEGGCSKLLVNGEKLKCKNALIHTEYADGRIGFYFLEDVVNGQILTFSGSGLEQKALSENVRIQPVDGVIQLDGFLNVFGECYFENPFIGPANLKCEAVDATGMQFQGHFLTDGLPPIIKDFTQNSNLDEAQRQTEFEISKGLLPYRCSDADSEGRSALHFLAKQKDTKPLMAFLEQDNSNINCVDDYGETPLHFAAALGSVHSIQILLENGADPRFQNNIGQGVLALAQENPALMEAEILNELANKFNKWSPNAAKVENTLEFNCIKAITVSDKLVCEAPAHLLSSLLAPYGLIKQNLSQITRLNEACVSFEFEIQSNELVEWELREIHDLVCGGDPGTAPKIASLKTSKKPNGGKISLAFYDSACGCWKWLVQ